MIGDMNQNRLQRAASVGFTPIDLTQSNNNAAKTGIRPRMGQVAPLLHRPNSGAEVQPAVEFRS
jgi:hypothetical protein